ncbi:MAG TPA: M1 family aminopeptidase, partial [Chitinophagaceae bacterium]|nr:M1 family aminopeptidase [Chitinophagaceae bacterium]
AFYQYSHAGVPVIWTLSQPFGAKFWWPCKDGLSDKADSIDIHITHPAIYTASANGMVVSRQVTDTMATTHFHHGYPIASYLVAMAVTNYVENNDTVMVGNKPYRFISYAYPEAAGPFFGQQVYAKDAFRIFSQLFGEYPFAKEKYGHTQFSWGGGMEHQTNSFMFNTSPNLSAHELGHQWFGDKVTCGSWKDIWLNEGFAQYSVILYTQYYHPSFYRSTLMNTLNSATSQPGGSVYVPDTTDFRRIFDGRLSYNKGAYVVHMLRWVLGDSALFKGLRQYLNDPALSFGFAVTSDLQRHLEQASGKDLDKFLQQWIYGEGYPNYQAGWSQNTNLWAKVKLNQTTSHPSVSFYEMPGMLEFRSATQSKRVIVDHRYSGQEFTVDVGFAADTVVIDPDLWILSRTKTSVKTAAAVSPDIINLYPNPSPRNVVLSLQNPTGNKLYLNLFNAAGQLVFKKEITTPGRDEVIHLPLERYSKGMYVLSIRNDKGLDVIKRIVH